MNAPSHLLTEIERRGLWPQFHKDWLVAMRTIVRSQLAADCAILVEATAEVVGNHYSLLLRRVPDQRLIAAIELLSPTNKGTYGSLDKEKYLRKRDLYFEAGVSLLEIDALLVGDRLLPPQAQSLATYLRTAWSASYDGNWRKFRGWGWNADEGLPSIAWEVEPARAVVIDLAAAFREACAFNPWERLVGVAPSAS